MRPEELRAAIEDELERNLLPFWRQCSIDRDGGGFIGEMANDGRVHADADKGLILNARILWTFAALFRCRGDERDLELARRACEYLLRRFRDRQHGGFFWRLDATGRVLDDAKKIYGQAFCIYALTEYHLADGDATALEEAKDLFGRIERSAHDEDHGGYIEVVAADWSPTQDLRLSDKDLDVAKSMNNHLHVLEAYTNLYRAWPDPLVAARLRELLGLFDRRILRRAAAGSHLLHFFDADWKQRSETYTYGHDIEAAWLLCEAAEVLGDEGLRDRAESMALELAASVLREAVDAEGGLAYEGVDGRPTDPNREWWCQAEAVIGFWQAWSMGGGSAFAVAAEAVWRFVEQRVVDRQNGEWFWRILPDGTADPAEPKVSEWKGPYHNVRMCLEMLRRLDTQIDEEIHHG